MEITDRHQLRESVLTHVGKHREVTVLWLCSKYFMVEAQSGPEEFGAGDIESTKRERVVR